MADYLVIVESPAKAKTIGKFLGKGYKIQASMGHVRDLPKSQLGVDVDNNFEPKYITIRGKGDLISKLKKDAKGVSKVFLATDPDREGEAISWHLANLLRIDEKDKCRITFNEITKTAVKNAIKAPRSIDMDLVDAQQARRVLDRIVGYKISPILWKKVRKGLSAGRVQSVATRLICEREEEIEKFIPEEYWTLIAKLAAHNKKTSFDAKFFGDLTKKIELKNEEQVNAILAELKNSSYIIQKIKKSEKTKSPAPPFITSTLQQDAARKLGFTTKKTMMVAQQLYEGVEVKGHGAIGLVTYIRTDSTRLSNDALDAVRTFINTKYGEKYLPNDIRVFKNKSASQDAHEAIRPSYVDMEPLSIKESLTNDQYKLYKLIWERFVACQMTSAVYDTMSFDIKATNYMFKASGSKIKFQGFMAVYVEGKDEDNEEKEMLLPDLNEGDNLDLKSLDPKQHFTQPPQRYNEATLVKVLEEKGIGRPSTYAPTITTILARYYVEKENKFFIPTDLGKIVTDIMVNHFKDVVNIQFTAQLEKQLDDVEEGSKKWVEVMKNFYDDFAKELAIAEENIGDVEIPDEVTDIVCERCGKFMVVKTGRFGKFLGCQGFPDCRNTKPIIEDTGVLCPKCGGKVLWKKGKKTRKKFLGCEKFPECDFVTWDKPSDEKCPKCGNFMLKKYSGKNEQLRCSSEACGYIKEG